MVVGLLLALSATGCGRKGPPKPLKPRAPVSLTETESTGGVGFSAAQRIWALSSTVAWRIWH
jgi:hypothetical protein